MAVATTTAGEPLVAFEERDLDALMAMVCECGADPIAVAHASTASAADGKNPYQSTQERPLSKTEKARLKSRRFYHRRVSLLQGLRDQVTELETTLRRVASGSEEGAVATHALQPLPALLQSLDELPHVLSITATTREERKLLMKKLLEILSRLHEENVMLRKLHQQSTQRFQYLHDLALADDSKLYMVNQASFALIRPLTLTDCTQIREKAIQEYLAFSRNDRYVTPAGSIYGWRERRVFENGVVNFTLSKTIYHHTAESIFERTWRMLSDPCDLRRMYSDSLSVRCYVVQVVDDSNVVLYHELLLASPPGAATNDQPVIVKTIFLISHFRTARGYFLLIRGLDSDRFEIRERDTSNASEVWNDLFAWIQSEKAGEKDEHCLSSYAGITPTVGADPKFWVAEIILHVLRWEGEVLGPRFSLPTDDKY